MGDHLRVVAAAHRIHLTPEQTGAFLANQGADHADPR